MGDRHSREWTVVGILAGLMILLAIFAPSFFDPQPFLSRLTFSAPKLVVACGVALVMICRQIDISVGSTFALSSVCAGLVASSTGSNILALLVAVVLGGMAGAVNGVLVAGLGLPSIVVTLATMVSGREAIRLWQQGVFINLPDNIQWFGLTMFGGQVTLCVLAFGVLGILAWGMNNLAAGRFIYATGSNVDAARLAGIRPRLVTFWVFVNAGALTGLAATMNMVQSPQVDPSCGKLLELEVIAAAVVGGVSVAGGRGNLWGVLVGFLVLACINPALIYLGVKSYWDKAIQGCIIL
jgi:rhamnose transport system permease protein